MTLKKKKSGVGGSFLKPSWGSLFRLFPLPWELTRGEAEAEKEKPSSPLLDPEGPTCPLGPGAGAAQRPAMRPARQDGARVLSEGRALRESLHRRGRGNKSRPDPEFITRKKRLKGPERAEAPTGGPGPALPRPTSPLPKRLGRTSGLKTKLFICFVFTLCSDTIKAPGRTSD